MSERNKKKKKEQIASIGWSLSNNKEVKLAAVISFEGLIFPIMLAKKECLQIDDPSDSCMTPEIQLLE
uniref:Uncharacterized protein n=1 Tax=Onchocerca volvulus TaxID=6282 RepID=A0A8R1XK76_ONCVO